MMNNACPSRITAAAGTSIGRDLNLLRNVIITLNKRSLQFINRQFIHVILLDQTFVHCPIFPTAAQKI
jgi:hypothetical protein